MIEKQPLSRWQSTRASWSSNCHPHSCV